MTLAEETERQRQEAEVVGALVRAINQSLDLDTVLQRVAEAATALCRSDQAVIALRDRPSGEMRFRYWAGARYEKYPSLRIEVGKGAGGRVLATGRPFRTDHYAKDSRITKDYLESVEANQVIATLVVPIPGAEGIEGLLYVENRAPRPFTDHDEAILARLADHSAIALQNARLFQESEERRLESEALTAVGRELTASRDLADLADRIVSSVLTLLGVQRALLYQFDSNTGALTCIAVAGRGDPPRWLGRVLPAGFGVAGVALEEGRILGPVNPLEDARFRLPDWAAELLRAHGQPAVLAIPLLVEERRLGALMLDTEPGRCLTDRELRTASAFASQASLALDKARHYADARRGQREAEVFTQLIHDISASLNLDVVLQRVAEAARELCTADVARIALRRPGSDTMPFRYWAGTLSEQYRSIAIEPGKGVGGQVLLTGRPFRTDDYVNDPRITKDYLHAVRADGISAVLGAPVRIESRIEGLLFVDRRSSRPFTDGDEAVLVRLADHAATAIANAELYAGQEERAARLRALCRLTQLVSSSLDTERVLGEITRSVAALSNAPAASLWIVDEGARTLEVRAFSDPVVGGDLRVRRQPVGDGLTGWVAVHRQSLHVPDVFADPRTVNADWWRAHGFTSFYGMPIADGDRLVGVLTLKGRRPFELTSDDDDLLRAFVAQAAVAIRNAWLFEESDRRRREAESSAKALAESEARYRGLVEGSIQGIWIHKDFIIQFANQMSARILGYEDAAALVGRDLREFVAPHERARLEGYYAARLRGDPAPRRYDFEAERVDGSRIWIENIATVVSWQNEPAILAALLDVTEMKRLEEQLRQAQKMEAVGQLAGGVAHDFNNLLTIIKGRSELLLQRRPLDARACRDAELIRGAADRAGALTRQLLAFSRRQLLRPRLLDLSALAVGLGPMLERLVDEHIALAVRPDVDSGPVFADPAHLEQVVMNLVVNARDAMPDGGRLTIDTAACELDAGAAQQRGAPGPGSYVVLSVRDTGCGMDEATRARIFEPFFTTKEKGKGTGLGLSTVYGIVQQSGGFIEVDTAVGRGSTFRVHLPRATESTDATGGGDVESAGPCSGDETVLLVEDEAAVRDLACEILEASGYSVLKAKDAEEALMLSAQHAGPVHLLVTDVVMPGMNGFELAHRLEAARPAIKCVFMSGYTDTALAQHGTLPPATNFLEKPFAPERLARFVRDVLDAPSAAPPATA